MAYSTTPTSDRRPWDSHYRPRSSQHAGSGGGNLVWLLLLMLGLLCGMAVTHFLGIPFF